jgi:hypothetical protein
MEEKI